MIRDGNFAGLLKALSDLGVGEIELCSAIGYAEFKPLADGKEVRKVLSDHGMRPITRGRLFVAKLVVAVVYAWVGVALVTAVGAIAGGIAFGFEGVSVSPFPIFGFEGGLALSAFDLVLYLLIATAYVAWMLMSVLAFSFLVGCITDSPAGAVLAGAGMWITMTILDQIESLGSLRNLLPPHYSGNWRWMFTDDRVSPDLWKGSLLTLGYVVVFVAVASWWFRRKDILS